MLMLDKRASRAWLLAAFALLVGCSVLADERPMAVIETTFGDITVELFSDRSPLAVENFLRYAEEGFYEGTIFHRVQKGTLIQGGGLTPGLQQKKPHDPIRNEAQNRVKNEKGTLAMARSGGIHTITSQFFINTNDNRDFDHRGMGVSKFGYPVFGKVIEGMDVVETIENLQTSTRNGIRDVPRVPVIIKKVRLAESSDPAP